MKLQKYLPSGNLHQLKLLSGKAGCGGGGRLLNTETIGGAGAAGASGAEEVIGGAIGATGGGAGGIGGANPGGGGGGGGNDGDPRDDALRDVTCNII